MNPEKNSWEQFAAAVRQLDAETAKADEPVPVAGPIAWLPDLSEQVHALFLRLIWKRWALAGIVVALAVLGSFYLASKSSTTDPRVPRIPVPSAP